MDDAWIRALRDGACLLTANRRLARQLREQHDRARLAAGETVWESPTILPWSAWLRRCWQEAVLDGGDPRWVLEPLAARAVWERVITGSAAASMLLRAAEVAPQAMEAWRLLHAWQVAPPALSDCPSDDVRAFLDWQAAYRAVLEQQGWLDEALLADAVAEAVKAGQMGVPPRLLLAGFDELTPQQQRLLEVLGRAGTHVDVLPLPVVRGSAVRRALPTAADEVVAMARWAREWLEREPTARVGVVVLDLDQRRDEIERVLSEVLLPDRPFPLPVVERPWNLSLGPALHDVPLVRDFFRLLELAAKGRLPFDQASLLLRSPWLEGWPQEQSRRALLDAELRREGRLTVDLATLHWLAGGRAAGREAPYAAPQLAAQLGALIQWRRDGLQGDPPLAGWARGRPLSSEEHQAWQAVLEAMQRLTALGAVVTLERFAERLRWLRTICREQRFQPRGAEAPLQVLGLLEAGGLDFDHLWVMGLHDEAWPPVARPNPFLPVAFQRRHGMPHASSERELAFAGRLFDHLAASAPDRVYSHPLRDGDRELRPSPLLAALPAAAEAVTPWPTAAARLLAAGETEAFVDEAAPPWRDPHVSGGSRLFELQSGCPFRAFAELRLGARALETPGFGMDLRQRGRLLHTALEHLWNRLRSQAALLALDAAARRGEVEEAVAAALRERRIAERYGLRWAALEQQRLAALIVPLLQLEAERAPFEVEANEGERQITFAGLALALRVDRIDRLADGSRVVIDYKSGQVGASGWLGERPEAPQLPLYAVTLDEGPLAALVHARLRHDVIDFDGVARDEGLLPGVGTQLGREPCTLAELLPQWDEALTRLAQQFAAGEAAVDPLPGACDWCPLGPLCRVAERRLMHPVTEVSA